MTHQNLVQQPLDLQSALLERFQNGDISFDVFQQLLTQLQDGTIFDQGDRSGSRDAPVGGNGEGISFGNLDAGFLDRLQGLGGFASMLGPVGMAANFGLGQLARTAANEAFPAQVPVGFLEDILKPDFIFGSPFQIQQKREQASRPEAKAAAARAGAELNRARNRDVERGNREGRTAGGALGRAAARSRNLGRRAG